MPRVRLPNITLRNYQKPVWRFYEGGGLKGVLAWHRRAGKDELALSIIAVKSQERVGNYHCVYPYQDQVRRAVWDAVTNGENRIDKAFPPAMVERKLDGPMTLHLKNGSTVNFIGSDNPNALVGSNPLGIVISEFALCRPEILGFLRPILAENGGWLLLISTPRGKNHFYRIMQLAKKEPGWFAEELPATSTDVFTPEQLQTELREYVAQYGEEQGTALFNQEMLVSFASGQLGSIYGSLIERAEREGRITRAAYDPTIPVVTAWDLGMRDSTAIWFLQVGAGQVRAIDYYSSNGRGLDHYIHLVRSKPYIYAEHIAPHDIDVRELGSGRSRRDIASDLGIDFTIAPKLSVQDGINATRMLLPRMWFDKDNCQSGLDALMNYRKVWDDKRAAWSDMPYHDWSSNGSDALRMFAVSTPLLTPQEYKAPDRYARHRKAGSASWMAA
jgi:hypothetical protein